MNTSDARLLTEFLASPVRPEGTLHFHELQGFLFAIACSPETIPPSEWLPMISNEESLNFADANEAQEILGLVMALYNEINEGVLERSNALPAGCAFDEDVLGTFDDGGSISQWAGGFASGHDWLAEVWEEYLFEELDEECGATLLVLSFFGSRQLANAYYDDMKPTKRRRGDESFKDFAETMRKMFPDALASYAHIGRSIFEAVLEYREGSKEPVVSTKVGPNKPCPCGSGKKYKKCCGGQIH